MGDRVLFSESQRFRQWWLWLIFLGIDALFIAGIFIQVIKGQPFGDNPMSNAGLVGLTLMLFLLTALFAVTRLDTQIGEEGIYVRFFPFQARFRHYSWGNLAKCYVRTYSPLIEFGGWGWRFGFGGLAYNVSGNQGLQLVLITGKRFLIGTSRAVEMEEVLAGLDQLKT